jgi:alkyl hydroperoxide reductase subunit D
MNTLIESLPSFAKDIKLNLNSVLADDASTGLNHNQTLAIALACAYACKHPELIAAMQSLAETKLSAAEIEASKAAATIMAMNNIYYRFIHLVHDSDYQSMPARLRMTVMANPGVDKKDFELYALAVSAINGCGMCMESHAKKLVSEGINKTAIQSAIRIAAVLHAAAQALIIAKA